MSQGGGKEYPARSKSAINTINDSCKYCGDEHCNYFLSHANRRN